MATQDEEIGVRAMRKMNLRRILWHGLCVFGIFSFALALIATLTVGATTDFAGYSIPFRPNLILGPFWVIIAIQGLRRLDRQ